MSFLSFRSVGPSLSIRAAFPLEGAVTLERNARAAEDAELTPSPMGRSNTVSDRSYILGLLDSAIIYVVERFSGLNKFT